MKATKLITLSTAHLHPLEAQHIDSVFSLYNEFSNLNSICDEVIRDCKDEHLPCLQKLLINLMKEGYDYVLFDADSDKVENELPVFDW